jgi:tripartite-type tricarboxylate transporter receptor subunit TctC
MIDSYSALKSMIDDKQVRALASSGPTRSPVTPNLPTAAESGVPGYDVTSWNAIFAPAGTPVDVIAKMQKSIAEVLAEDEIKRKLLDLGIEAKATTGAQLAKRLDDDIVKWGDVIAKANIPKN